MSFFLFFCLFLAFAYSLLMLLYGIGWALEPEVNVPTDFTPTTRIGVMVPARNEAANIRNCIDSILGQKYPAALLRITVIDDHSTDETAAIVESYNHPHIQCLRLEEHLSKDDITTAYKKRALSLGISRTECDLVVTTDADCVAGPDWLKMVAACYERTHPVAIAGPVEFTSDGRLVEAFQSLDFASLQGITVATHRMNLGSMSNGANFAFQKKAFQEVNGYEGVDKLASGDDFLLLWKLRTRYPNGVAYLKSKAAIVRTPPQPTWTDFLHQRIRWASKSGKYKDHRLTASLALVYLFNFTLLVSTIIAFFFPPIVDAVLRLWMVKLLVELAFLVPVTRFYGMTKQLIWFPVFQPLHLIYVVLAGFLGLVGKYQWKGRSVR